MNRLSFTVNYSLSGSVNYVVDICRLVRLCLVYFWVVNNVVYCDVVNFIFEQ